MNQKLIKKITLSGMLIVVNILLTAIPRYFQIGTIFTFNRITLGPAVTIFSSLILGPLYGGIIGGASDLLGWLIFPNSGAMVNLFITLIYTLLGIVPFYLMKILKKRGFARDFSLFCAFFAVFVIFISSLIFTSIFDQSFIQWGWNIKTTKIVISIVLFVFVCSSIYLLKLVQKKFGDEAIKIGLICLVSEICLMVFGKPFAFLLYCKIVYGSALVDYYGVTYSFLVIISLMFACVMIPLNTFAVSSFKKLFDKIYPNK